MMIEMKLSPKITPQIAKNNSALHCPIVFLIYTTFKKLSSKNEKDIY